MKDIRLDSAGDAIFSGGDIQLIENTELLAQKCRMVLSTRLGEWQMNSDEGIDFGVIFVKNPSETEIINEIQLGLKQIDETLIITEYKFENKGRSFYISFNAKNSSGETVSLTAGNDRELKVDVLICTTDMSEHDALNSLKFGGYGADVLNCV